MVTPLGDRTPQREESLSVKFFMAWVSFFAQVGPVFQPLFLHLWALTDMIDWYHLTTGRLLWHHCESNCSDCSSSTSGTGTVAGGYLDVGELW